MTVIIIGFGNLGNEKNQDTIHHSVQTGNFVIYYLTYRLLVRLENITKYITNIVPGGDFFYIFCMVHVSVFLGNFFSLTR